MPPSPPAARSAKSAKSGAASEPSKKRAAAQAVGTPLAALSAKKMRPITEPRAARKSAAEARAAKKSPQSEPSARVGKAAQAPTTPAAGTRSAKVKCGRCDGGHESSVCPHFRKQRFKHPDAQAGKPRSIGRDAFPLMLRRCRVVSQPGDGSCLYHSLRYGLKRMRGADCVPDAKELRHSLARWVASNGQLRIAETPLSLWVRWDSGLQPSAYANRMARSGWGGGIEMAACSHLMNCNIWVYERCRGGFERISCFDAPAAANRSRLNDTLHILYRGGVHYDALLVETAELQEVLARAPSPSKQQQQQQERGVADGSRRSAGKSKPFPVRFGSKSSDSPAQPLHSSGGTQRRGAGVRKNTGRRWSRRRFSKL